jgi:hypothetical protein
LARASRQDQCRQNEKNAHRHQGSARSYFNQDTKGIVGFKLASIRPSKN